MVSGITPCAQECKWTDYFGETPKDKIHYAEGPLINFCTQNACQAGIPKSV